MCGHGLISAITLLLEENIIVPKEKGCLRVETPAGLVWASYTQEHEKITQVRFENVAAFLALEGITVIVPFGELTIDVLWGKFLCHC